MVESINNFNIQQNINTADEESKSVQNSYNAQDINKSIFNINNEKLSGIPKQIWDKNFKDLDGNGIVSEGDFSNEELNLSNGNKTFKEYLTGIMGKPWSIAENVITNIKAMFIKSMPETEQNNAQNNKNITDYIKDNKLIVGESFEHDGIKYNVGYNNTAIAQSENYKSETQTYTDGKAITSTFMEDQLNTTISDENGKTITDRTDYDDGSAHIKDYNQQADITIRAPKTKNDIPFIRIKE